MLLGSDSNFAEISRCAGMVVGSVVGVGVGVGVGVL